MRRIAAIFVGMFLVAATVAWAESPKGMMHGKGMQRGQGGWGGQLSPEQGQVMQDIYARYYDEMIRLYSERASYQAQMNAALAQEKVDAGKVRELAGKLGDAWKQLWLKRADMMIEMREKGLPAMPMGQGQMMGPGMGKGMMGSGGGCPWMDNN